MRYLVWKLTWGNGKYGVGPEGAASSAGAHLEASPWANPTVEQGEILGYLAGDMDLATLADWSVRELTQAEALAFAKSIHPAAFLLDNGVIGAPAEVTP